MVTCPPSRYFYPNSQMNTSFIICLWPTYINYYGGPKLCPLRARLANCSNYLITIWICGLMPLCLGVLGLCVGDKWAAWCLVDSWNSCGQDIGWAEAMAIELAASWLTQCGWWMLALKSIVTMLQWSPLSGKVALETLLGMNQSAESLHPSQQKTWPSILHMSPQLTTKQILCHRALVVLNYYALSPVLLLP